MAKQISKEEDRGILYKGIAPHIIGNEVLKQFLMLQMFANPENGESLNYIILGPAASAKSETSRFASKVIGGRSRYMRDPTIPGLKENLIASDCGIVFFDEFDKSTRLQRNTLLEALSDGVTTIDKHGEHYPYPSRISLSALCNPSTSQFSNAPLMKQLSFSREQHIMSRFHFIIPTYPPSTNSYEQIAMNSEMKWSQEQMIEIMNKKILDIRQEVPNVSIPEELRRRIGREVVNIERRHKGVVMVTARLIYGFLSAVKARSRWMGRSEANEEDLDYILELYQEIVR